MEARWINFEKACKTRIMRHLSSYEKILVLKAFDQVDEHFEYQLIEIPIDLLKLIGSINSHQFLKRTDSGGTSAKVLHGGRHIFTLRLDGSVEKITIAGLDLGLK